MKVNQIITQVAIGNNNIQIAGQQITKRVKYKGWLIQWNEEAEMYQLFTPEEMEQPAGFREVEWEAGDIKFAKQWIDHY